MSKVQPFRGYRINPSFGWEAYSYMSPLREIISEAQLERLRSFPNNSIHVASPLNVDLASQKLSNWIHNKFWIQDQIPSFYPCYQQFAFYGSSKTFVRKGFIAKILLKMAQELINNLTITKAVQFRLSADQIFYLPIRQDLRLTEIRIGLRSKQDLTIICSMNRKN